MTNIRARIVQRDTLNKIALELGLDKLVKTSAKTGHNTHMYGNALEALIGAIYLDQGYRVTKRFVYEKMIKEHLNIDEVAQVDQNYKSRLIEWGQKMKIPVSFELIDTSIDKENSPYFKSLVCIYDIKMGEGGGHSKKESQQNASAVTLQMLEQDTDLYERIMKRKEEERESERGDS